MKKLGILTSGGDSQGMNPTIVAITNAALVDNCEVFYVLNGYSGLYKDRIIPSTKFNYQQYANLGGTFIGSSRFPEFSDAEIRKVAIKNLKKRAIDKLVVIGGDGSYKGALKLAEDGVICAGLPGTIDNDVVSTQYSIGFDTALNNAVISIRNIKDTMQSHSMCCVVELMGRHCSDLAVFAGIASSATFISINEHKLSEEEIVNNVKKSRKNGEKGIIIVVSEYTYDVEALAKRISKEANISTRHCILGHTQRGGNPTAMESYRSSLMGWKAYNELKTSKAAFCVGWNKNEPVVIDIKKALKMKNPNRTKLVKTYNRMRIK